MKKLNKINQDKKSTIAKLLAEENVHVVHRQTETASFNVATRELTLPILKSKISEDLYDLFVCHEVGHALWTPLDMMKKITDLGVDKSVVNVLEDVRIEAMIQKKYPGSVKNFQNGYKELVKKNFFGIKNKKLEDLNIIDKINIFYKTGLLGKVSKKEKDLIKKVSKCKTPEDVIKLAVEIAGYHKKEKKKNLKSSDKVIKIDTNPNDKKEKNNGSDSSDSEISDNEAKKELDEFFGKQDNEDSDKKDEDKKGKEDSSSCEHASKGGSPSDGVLKSSTDNLGEQSFGEQIIDKDALDNLYVNTPSKIIMKNLMIDYKKVLEELNDTYWNNKDVTESQKKWKIHIESTFQKMYNENRKVVSYMVKEFEMKKSADQYKRTTTAKTGMLDMDKIHTYKYNDDLFAKMNTIPGATNHGFIMYLDWSGSMAYNMNDTIKQLLNLIWFCQRVKIPYQVLAFTDKYHNSEYRFMSRSFDRDSKKWEQSKEVQYPVHNDLNISEVRLIEFFSSDMTKIQTNTMMKYLVAFSECWNDRYSWQERMARQGETIYPPDKYNLGGTPLDAAILTMDKVESMFVEKHKVQKSNVIILTDGDSHGVHNKFTLSPEGWKCFDDASGYGSIATITDKKTNKTVRMEEKYRHNSTTTAYLKLLKKIKPHLTITGFFIAGSGRAGRVSLRIIESKFGYSSWKDKDKVIKVQKELRKNKVAVCKTQGYDEYYILPVIKDMENRDIVLTNNKISSMKKAFTKSMNAKTVNRQLLNKFIGMVA